MDWYRSDNNPYWANIEQFMSDFIKSENIFFDDHNNPSIPKEDKQNFWAANAGLTLQSLQKIVNTLADDSAERDEIFKDRLGRYNPIVRFWTAYATQQEDQVREAEIQKQEKMIGEINEEVIAVEDAASVLQNFLFAQLQNFEEAFTRYTKDIVHEHADYNERAQELLRSIIFSDGDVAGKTVDIFSFNYTTPFSTSLFNNAIHGIRNIHGTLNNNDIIIGIDSAIRYGKQLPNESNQFTKTVRVQEGQSQDDHGFILSSQYQSIKFFGHSLGVQDYSYFHDIFNRINLCNSNTVLQFPGLSF